MVQNSLPLRSRVTCPHCWKQFAPKDALYISQHPDLLNDPRLGPDHQQRFLPTRFTVDGAALDARGYPCHALACPGCHLEVPRIMFEMHAEFFSILGAPSCGKTYFLASMTWQLRRTLPHFFQLAFSDADPEFNSYLNEYEEQQFLNPDQDRLISLRKTEEQGDLFNTVLKAGETVTFPRPFVFTLRPLKKHPSHAKSAKLSRAICLYDNAGENFLPGKDSAGAPVTRHLALSRTLLFLFDPTQDLRFRRACQGQTHDPQMQERSSRLAREWAGRQDLILNEAAQRVRRFAGIRQNEKHNRPLLVVVTKYDAWKCLLDDEPLTPPWVPGRNTTLHGLDIDRINAMSRRVREVLFTHSPEIVAAAEAFSDHVTYIPVSAMGQPPEEDRDTGALGIRPRDINPQWVEVPLLYAICLGIPGIIPYRRNRNDAQGPPQLRAFTGDPADDPQADDAGNAASASSDESSARPFPSRTPKESPA
jgi:hypothetical protein